LAKIESAFFDIGALDTLAGRDTPVHRLDPRAKLLTTLVFVVAVASFGKYEISALLPFFLYPVSLIALGDLPAGYLAKKLLLVAPFAFFIGVFNPLLDREILVALGPIEISGGWISFASILLRFVLTVGAALILIATTSFPGVCMALERLGAPKVFAVQLLLLHRYLFVLVDEGVRLVRARALRSFGKRGMGMTVFGHLAGQLLLRTLERARRIHLAMLCRGFDGDIRMLRPIRIGPPEIVFTLGWSAAFILMRFINLPRLLGGLLTEFAR
jgi:cobalt/nickel transport system permease protein